MISHNYEEKLGSYNPALKKNVKIEKNIKFDQYNEGEAINIYLPGIGVLSEDLIDIIKMFGEHNKKIKIVDFKKIINDKKDNPQDLFKEIDNLIPSSRKIDYLVGQSFGGGIALEYAIKNPDKINNLILIDPYIIKTTNYVAKLFDRLLDIIRASKKASSRLSPFLFLRKYLSRINLLLKEVRLINQFDLLGRKNRIVNVDTFFLWAELDKTCPIKNYDLVKKEFKKNYTLIKVLKDGHDWSLNKKLLQKQILKTGIFN